MTKIEQKAVELFQNGFSCSESIIRAAYEENTINQNIDIEFLNQIASSFSGGMGESGCLCGAVASAQIVLGANFGRKDKSINAKNIKSVSKSFVEKFKAKRKATCCKVLTSGYDFNSPERKSHCVNIVKDVAEMLETHLKENAEALKKI